MSKWIDRAFPNWFIFGGYSDPGFKGTRQYNPDAPCDLADAEGDVWTSIPYPVAQKLIHARNNFLAELEAIEQEYPDLCRRYER